MEITHLVQTKSTQVLAREITNTRNTKVFLADSQECSVGKDGSQWITFPNSFAASFVFEFDGNLLERVQLLTPLILCSYFQTQEPHSRFTISFPNDVYKNGRKMCGILIEQQYNVVIVGIGFNILYANDDFEKLDVDVPKLHVIQYFNEQLKHYVNMDDQHGLLAAYYEQLEQNGKMLTYENQKCRIVRAVHPGCLIIEDCQTNQAFYYQNTSIKNHIISD